MIDFGGSGSAGPFIQWQARASLDGEFNAKSWVLRTSDGKSVFTAMSRGVVFDIDALKLGWCKTDGIAGQAPEWKWNPSVKRFEPMPGEGWKRGFSIPIAINANDTAIWEQAQAGAFSAIVELFGLVGKAHRQPDTLPVVRHNGETKIESKRGMTFAPKLEILKWVPRPTILGGGGPAFEEPKAQPAQAVPPADRKPEPAMAGADEDMPF